VLGKDDPESESALVMFTVTNARAISGKSLFALVDVEMQIAGVCFAILGVQARNAPNGCPVCIRPAAHVCTRPLVHSRSSAFVAGYICARVHFCTERSLNRAGGGGFVHGHHTMKLSVPSPRTRKAASADVTSTA